MLEEQGGRASSSSVPQLLGNRVVHSEEQGGIRRARGGSLCLVVRMHDWKHATYGSQGHVIEYMKIFTAFLFCIWYSKLCVLWVNRRQKTRLGLSLLLAHRSRRPSFEP